MAKTVRESFNAIRKIKSPKGINQTRTKGTIAGAFTGMGVGMLIGYTKRYNLISSALLGAVIGGLAAQLILPKND